MESVIGAAIDVASLDVLFVRPSGASGVPIALCTSSSARFSQDISYANQVVDSVGQGKDPSSSLKAFVSCLTSKPPGQFGLEKEWMV